MPRATMSILGLYNYDNTIFDSMALPAQVNSNKAVLINNLLMECSEFEIIYTDPEFMKDAIGAWSGMMVDIWEKLYATTQFNYDPIANYDRNETWTDTDSRRIQNDRTPNLTTSYQINDTKDIEYGKSEIQSENSYENAGFVGARKNENEGGDTIHTVATNSDHQTGTDQNIEQHSGTISHMARAYGNIGVTTTQQMIEQERETVQFNIFKTIIEDFKMRFCLMIY